MRPGRAWIAVAVMGLTLGGPGCISNPMRSFDAAQTAHADGVRKWRRLAGMPDRPIGDDTRRREPSSRHPVAPAARLRPRRQGPSFWGMLAAALTGGLYYLITGPGPPPPKPAHRSR